MPRNTPRKTDRGRYDQASLEMAAHEIEMGGTLRDVAPNFGMSVSTLSRALKRKRETGVMEKKSIGVSTLFTQAQEREFAEYLKSCAKMFHGVGLKQAQQFAYSFACTLGITFPESWHTNKEAGEEWLSAFRKRNDDISLRVPEPTSLARIRGFNREAIGQFFDNIEEVREAHRFTPHQIWNLDETGCMTVQKTSRVLAPKGVKQLGQVTSQERGTLVTVCCCVNAAGESLPPAYIFPRVHFQHHMLKRCPPGSLGLAVKSGWMTSESFLKVLAHFISFMRVSRESPALLIMDNHTSHVSPDVVKLVRDHGIVIVTIPPHCSHRIQPLDLSVYGPFKAYYNRAMSTWMRENPGIPVTIYEVAELSNIAILKAATPENVQKGFLASGLHPLNRDVFTDDMFLATDATEIAPITAGSSLPQGNERPAQTNSGLPSLPIIPPQLVSHNIRKKRSTILAFPLTTTPLSSSSEEEEDEPVLADSSSDCSIPSSSSDDDEEAQCADQIEEGDHLVVSVEGKKGSKNFIAQVLAPENEEKVFTVSFLRRSCKGNHFLMAPEGEESQIDATQVIVKLPRATMIGGSARRQKMFHFQGAEKRFNVE